MAADARTASPSPLLPLLDEVIDACEAWSRHDLAGVLRDTRARLRRPTTLVGVLGEYKKGKSLLVNALVGREVCPVDDDVATAAITAVSYADTPTARIRRRVDGEVVEEAVDVAELWRYASERGAAADRVGIELIEIGVPSPLLSSGLTLVDTPGVGGLLEHHTTATLRFLRLVDAALFVTDASQELTATELAFLEQAGVACPDLRVVVTKTDLYPAWEEIVARDLRHLTARGLDLAPIPLATALQMEAWRRAPSGVASGPAVKEARGSAGLPAELTSESGVPQLRALLETEIGRGAGERAAARAVDELVWAVDRLLEPVDAELTVLEDPDEGAATTARLDEARTRLEQLQRAGARWATVLNDGFTDLRAAVNHDLVSSVRTLLADIDRELEDQDPAEDWDGFTGRVRERCSELGVATLTRVDEGAAEIAARIIELLQDEETVALVTGAADARAGVPADIDERWSAVPRELRGGAGLVATGLATLRGSSSGVILLGMLGNLAGASIAGPVSIGVAVVFGARQFADLRSQARARRRQEARGLVRSFVDEVNLDITNRVRQAVQEHHRRLRDHFSGRLAELARSAAMAAQAADEAMATEAAARGERSERLRVWRDQLVAARTSALAAVES